jgi:16S rRNA (guanine1207-N2)-methyltransferase
MYTFEADDSRLTIETAPGVFSADGPDPGSELLIRELLPHAKPHQKILDIGCGAGLIGLSLSRKLTRGEVWLVDVDIRAVRLTQKNIERNGLGNAHCLLSDGTLDLPKNLRFDIIASNPPTHDGRAVLETMVHEAQSRLRPGGSLWVVVNRLLSMRHLMDAEFGNVKEAARSRGYVVFTSTRERVQAEGG